MKLFFVVLSLTLLSCSITKHKKQPELLYESLLYTTSTYDQQQIQLRLFLPEETKANGTLVVLAGDLPPNVDQTNVWVNKYHELGYIVVQYVPRFYIEQATPRNPTTYFSQEDVVDLMTAIAWTKANIQYEKLGVHSFGKSTLSSILTAAKINLDFFLLENPILDPIKHIDQKIKANEADTLAADLFQLFPSIYQKSKSPLIVLLSNSVFEQLPSDQQDLLIDSKNISTTVYPSVRSKKENENWNYWDTLPKLINSVPIDKR